MLPATLYGQLQLNDPLAAQAAALQAALAANSTTATNASSNTSSESTPTGSRDTTYTKIFVGGLPYHTTDKTLHDYFRQFGEIEEAVVITDRQTQKSRGYGFVTMKERSDAEKACKDPNPIIDGRKANVNLAYLGAKPRNNVQLAGSLASFPQFPLQAQLQALLPGRVGLPQLFYQGATAAQTQALVNPLAAAQLPASAIAVIQAQAAQQNLVSQANAAAALSAAHSQQQAGAVNYMDYATLAAAASAGQNHALLHPAVSASSGLEQYGYAPYGVLPNAYTTQLTAAQAAQLVAASSGAHGALDGQRLS